METLTPMMQQYLTTKKEYPDCILFYRLGDFYEMFFDDALTVSRELELTLTGKSCGLPERAPMCGVPWHSADTYLNRLVSKGYKVAICEQMEEAGASKGIVRREVVRIVTPGTNLNMEALDETKNNYIMCIVYTSHLFGISLADVTTGEFYVSEIHEVSGVEDEIIRYSPSEIICNESCMMSGVDFSRVKALCHECVFPLDSSYFDDKDCCDTLKNHFGVESIHALGISEFKSGIIAAGVLLAYLKETQKNSLSHVTSLLPLSDKKTMFLDSSTRRNLELCETMREKQKKGTLLWVLDKTKTAMGARELRKIIEKPFIDKQSIDLRLDGVQELLDKYSAREEIREYLGQIYDLERLMCKISYQSANPRDLIAFKNSIAMLPHITHLMEDMESSLLMSLASEIDTMEDLFSLIDNAIDDEAPIALKEGGIIRSGCHAQVDELRAIKDHGREWMTAMEEKEKEETGIKTLKIRYNKVFGYYIEVTNSFKDSVPQTYIRKQTLANAERFITPELKEMEDKILGAEDRLCSLEYQLYCEIRKKLAENVNRIQKTAKAVSMVDCVASLAQAAKIGKYVRPSIHTTGTIKICDGRHPVVEKMMSGNSFITNDTLLDDKSHRVCIITGPNMAGKSTYMRQTALIVLMAQIGSFVPASSAEIGLVDRIFTRVGASDDLASGQSTFMVEMTEVASILRHATSKSLLILDEIGRGTSTFDGLSIAWAVVEHISNPGIIGAKTLFATHYHELTELEGKIDNVTNYCISVREKGEDIIFLRKIVRGGADKSYGIQVARLAGVPEDVIHRAREIIQELVDTNMTEKIRGMSGVKTKRKKGKRHFDDVDMGQLSLFTADIDREIIEEIKQLEIETLTPMEALNLLHQYQNKARNRWKP